MIQPPRGFGENPVAIYHDPDLPPVAPLPGRVPLAGRAGGRRLRRGRGRAPGQARHAGVAARQGPRAVRRLRAGRRARRPAAGLPVHRQRPRRGHPGQAARRTPSIVDHLVPPMARAETYGDMAKLEQLLDEYATVQALDPAKVPTRAGADLGRWSRPPQLHHDLHADGEPGRRRVRRLRAAHRRLPVRGQGRADPRRAAHPRRRARPARRGSTWCSRCCAPPRSGAAARRAARPAAGARRRVRPGRAGAAREPGPRGWHVPRGADRRWWTGRPAPAPTRSTCSRRWPGGWSSAWRRSAGTPTRSPRWSREVLGRAGRRRRRGAARSPPPRWCPGWTAPPTRSTDVLRALDGGYVPAGPSGSPTRGLVNVLPTGRNFYSVDPKAIPSPQRLGRRRGAGRLAAGPAPRRHRRVPALGRADRLGHRGHAHPGRRHRRGAGAARLPPGLGRRVAAGHRLRGGAAGRAGPARGSTSRCASPASSATRSRTSSRCSTTRSGAVAALDEPAEDNYRARARRRRRRRARRRAAGHRPDLRLQARARTAPGCCR